ncbi:hypothetical protein WN51_10818 [Melipona quadrifasciata]|uniref:Uncharacterized protein n=1 Tax=Melipona quadrifasciata TaxID=166423 RepID=A0A0N0BI06_9HYME|nr:hypothetical protein WN51_10818 [Melipona quadrifasciata]
MYHVNVITITWAIYCSNLWLMHSSEHLAKPKRKTPVQRHTGSTSFETIRDYLILRIDCMVRVSPEGSHVKLPRGDLLKYKVLAVNNEPLLYTYYRLITLNLRYISNISNGLKLESHLRGTIANVVSTNDVLEWLVSCPLLFSIKQKFHQMGQYFKVTCLEWLLVKSDEQMLYIM